MAGFSIYFIDKFSCMIYKTMYSERKEEISMPTSPTPPDPSTDPGGHDDSGAGLGMVIGLVLVALFIGAVLWVALAGWG